MKWNSRLLLLLPALVLAGICPAQTECEISGSFTLTEKGDTSCAMKSSVVTSNRVGLSTPVQSNHIYKPVLESMSFPNRELDLDSLQMRKSEITKTKLDSASSLNARVHSPSELLNTISIGVNFEGNSSNGCPPDNTIAIANNGNIVSIVNGNVATYDQAGTFYNQWTLYNFINIPSLPFNLCDPKVIYDSDADKFVFYAQTNDPSATSQFILAFSTTSNPNGFWATYTFAGNPLGSSGSFDYPKIAITSNEVIVTCNLFNTSGSFSEAIIYQVDKWAGYSGASVVNAQYWYGISGYPFSILPLRNGQAGTYGNGMYFVSTNPGGGSQFNLYYLTDQMSASSEQLLFYSYSVNPGYSAPGNSYQLNTNHLVNTGDCRAMDGYYQNGIIHFVQNVNDAGWCAIRYYRWDVVQATGNFQTTTFAGTKDYCYPCITPFSNTIYNQASILTFLASGPSIYPEMRAKYIDHSFVMSASILLKQGLGPVYNCYDPSKYSDRWGDYSGSTRKHNSALPRVWVSGCYGNSFGSWNTYIVELYDPNPVSVEETDSILMLPVLLYPNPSASMVSVDFEDKKVEELTFEIYDDNGKKVDLILSAYSSIGLNRISFSVESLSDGIYFLRISTPTAILKNEKFIVKH